MAIAPGVPVCSDASVGEIYPGAGLRPVGGDKAEISHRMMCTRPAFDPIEVFIALAAQLAREAAAGGRVFPSAFSAPQEQDAPRDAE